MCNKHSFVRSLMYPELDICSKCGLLLETFKVNIDNKVVVIIRPKMVLDVNSKGQDNNE